MRFSKDELLPRIHRRKDKELEEFIVSEINKELKKLENTNEHYDLIQMQYFLESVFDSKDRREKLLKDIQK